jgi:hypothetical protein
VLFTSLKALPFIAVATTVVFRNLGVLLVSFGDYIMGSKVRANQDRQPCQNQTDMPSPTAC